MNQEGETAPFPAYISVTQGGYQKGLDSGKGQRQENNKKEVREKEGNRMNREDWREGGSQDLEKQLSC